MSKMAIISPRTTTTIQMASRFLSIRPIHPIRLRYHHTVQHRRCPKNPSSSSGSPVFRFRIIALLSEAPRAVGFSYITSGSYQTDFQQVRRAPTPPSKSWVMDHLEQCGCAIGMGRYPPIPPYLLCNAEQAQDQSGLENGWWQSSE